MSYRAHREESTKTIQSVANYYCITIGETNAQMLDRQRAHLSLLIKNVI